MDVSVEKLRDDEWSQPNDSALAYGHRIIERFLELLIR
jgi:hypothetical protein